MVWGTQGYLWLPYDLTEVIKLIRERFEPKNFFFKKILFVIPSVSLSFFPYYCHSIVNHDAMTGDFSTVFRVLFISLWVGYNGLAIGAW